jgi:transposase
MGKPYSLDLRERIVAYIEAGHSARAAGRVFGVSASTAVRLVAAWRSRASLAARPQGRVAGTAGKLAAHRAFLVEVVQAEPDITLKELAGALLEAEGVKANVSSLHRALKACGQTYKKRPDRVRA